MADELTGSINELRAASSTSAAVANFVTNVTLLPHPSTCISHIAFKIAIAVSYFIMPYLLGYITGAYPDFILTFELIAILAYIDFWVVKNCSSSTLAGITWYCDNTTGKQVFVHKAVKDEMFLNQQESNFFWAVMYLWPAPWALNIMYKIAVLDIPTVTLSAVVLTFALINLLNCLKCSQEKRNQTSQLAGQLTTNLMKFAAWPFKRETTIPN